jgi:hypothetical protein
MAGRFARNQILFTGTRRRMTSVAVRGDQMAEELNGLCLRCRYLCRSAVSRAPALIWIVEVDLDLYERFRRLTPQLLDVINPGSPDEPDFEARQRFRYLMLNTRSSVYHIGPEPADGWKTWVVPHHHCNCSGYILSDERLERPRTMGYVGEPPNLHDYDAIKSMAEKLGLQWVDSDTRNLAGYRDIDIGVAWTRREELRDLTRSNIKMVNFAAHGIPSVLCDYESYQDANASLGGGACLIRGTLNDFLEGMAELATNAELRYEMSRRARPALEIYSRASIARLYESIVAEAREDFFGSRAACSLERFLTHV